MRSVSILGYNFSSPVFISPAARAGYGDERAELNFAQASGEAGTLYVAALYATKSIEEIASAKVNTSAGPQVIFQQVCQPSPPSAPKEEEENMELT